MDWSQIASDFTADGSLRDIYICGTSMDDWVCVWAVLTAESSSLEFTIDGEPRMPPAVTEVFMLSRAHSVCASYKLGQQRLNCHFFCEEEIEFDLDPRDVVGLDEAKQLAEFMKSVGRATSKKVRLTPENEVGSTIARYEPATDEVVWRPTLD
ncbi:hypothetical protein BRX43_15775 [Sphingomonas sp. S-NIH.Pt15_0812]|nr:hypothetical protein BRX43_15775 [Sphingomonas sp. S-NIH.Pt15_0812]